MSADLLFLKREALNFLLIRAVFQSSPLKLSATKFLGKLKPSYRFSEKSLVGINPGITRMNMVTVTCQDIRKFNLLLYFMARVAKTKLIYILHYRPHQASLGVKKIAL